MLEKIQKFNEIRFFDTPTKRDLHNFFRNFASYIESGTGILEALQKIRCNNKTLQESIQNIAISHADGVSLSEAFELESKIFPQYCITAIKAGTKGDQLLQAIRNICGYISQERMLERKVKPTMRYVKSLSTLFIIIFVLMIKFYLPSMLGLFKMDQANTAVKIVVTIFTFLGANIMPIVLFLVAIVAGFHFWSKKNSYLLDSLMFKIPLYKDVYYNKIQYKFTTTMSMMLGAGMDNAESLYYTSKVINNALLTDVLQSAIELNTSGGRKLVVALSEADSSTHLLDQAIFNFIEIGEKNRDIKRQLEIISNDYYDDVVEAMDVFIDNLTKLVLLLGSITLIIMAIAVYGPYLENLKSISRMGKE